MRTLIVLVLLALPLASLAAEDNIKANTMTVRGEAITKIAPDLVTLPITIRQEEETLQIAKSRHDDKLGKLLKLASDLGIPKDKIETSYTSVEPVYNYEKDSSRPRLRGYQVQTSLNFKLTDFSKLSDFMNGAIAIGIENIGSVSYSLQDEDKVKNDTLNLAMEHAAEKAARLAATAKVTLDKPLIIDEGDVSIERPQLLAKPMGRMRFEGAASASASPDLPAAIIEIRQSVTVTYSLK